MDLFSNFLKNDSVVTEIGVLEDWVSPDSISIGFPMLMTSTSTTFQLALVRPALRRRTGGYPTSILPISVIIEPFFEKVYNKSIAT